MNEQSLRTNNYLSVALTAIYLLPRKQCSENIFFRRKVVKMMKQLHICTILYSRRELLKIFIRIL